MQETHSSLADENKWVDELKRPKVFSYGKTKSCGIAIEYIKNNKVDISDKKIDKNERILVLDVKFYDTNFIILMPKLSK